MLFSVKSLTKSYDGRLILDGVDLDIQSGETIAITGPSGSGKTTFLNLLGALDRPDGGQILYNNLEINLLSEKDISMYRNRDIGFIFQKHFLLPQLTVLENTLLPTLAFRVNQSQKFYLDRANNLLEKVGLKNFKNQLPQKLSGGECQRVAFVRAMICNPKAILADEPTGSLDQETASVLSDLLLELNLSLQTTLIVVTHSDILASKMHKKYRIEHSKLASY